MAQLRPSKRSGSPGQGPVRSSSLRTAGVGPFGGRAAANEVVGLSPERSSSTATSRTRSSTTYERSQHRRDRVRISGRLECYPVDRVEPSGPGAQILWTYADAALVTAQPVLDDGDLGERTMNIHTNESHSRLLSAGWDRGTLRAEATETDSRSQCSRTSRRGGQVLTPARSSMCSTACPSLIPPVHPGPDHRTLEARAGSESTCRRCHTRYERDRERPRPLPLLRPRQRPHLQRTGSHEMLVGKRRTARHLGAPS